MRISKRLKFFLAVALTAWVQLSFAQLPEPLSTDPEDVDTYLEKAFRPYFFDPIDDITDGNQDAHDLNDFRIILNYNYRF